MDLTEAYEIGKFIPNGEDYAPRWAARAAAFRAGLGARAREGLRYGTGARQRFDLFLPEGAARGLLVFIHGGYWLKFDASSWSHLAAGPLARGWAVAMPTYRLAPEVRISQITGDIAAALAAASAEVPGASVPIVVTGHSAGGHLAARMRCVDVSLPGEVAARLGRIVANSPLVDLRPLMQTAMNAELRIDAAEAAVESPVLCGDLRAVDTVVWVGAQERPALLDQARWLSEAWPGCALRIAPGRHHFDVLDEMCLPDSPLSNALLDGVI